MDEEEFRKYLRINTETYQVRTSFFIHFNCYNLTCHLLKKGLLKFNLIFFYVYSVEAEINCNLFMYSRQMRPLRLCHYGP